MHIAGVPKHSPGPPPVPPQKSQHRPEALKPTESLKSAEAEALPVDGGSERAKGVLGLVESDHFQGVAALRLRINFHEELAQRSREATQPVVESELDELVGSAGELLDQLAASDDIDGEALADFRTDFEDSISTLKHDFLLSGGSSTSELLASLGGAIAELSSNLRELVMPEGDEIAPVDETAPVEQVDPGEILDSLETSLQQAQASLAAAIETSGSLPPPPPPNGNGVAYERFLGILQDLDRGVALDPTVDPEAEPSVPLDVVA